MNAEKEFILPVHPELHHEKLYRKCDPATLGIETTAELSDLGSIIGQPRARKSLAFGSQVDGPGFNIFVMGLPASGRTTLSREFLEKEAADLPVPDDLCYVNNFENPHQPRALLIPAGRGKALKQDLGDMISSGIDAIARAFSSEPYQQEQKRLQTVLERRQEAAMNRLRAYAARFNFLIVRTPFGFVLTPAVEGQPLAPEDLEKLPPEALEKLKNLETMISEEVKKTIAEMRAMEREIHQKIGELDRRTAFFIIEPLVDEMRTRYEGLTTVYDYLDAIVTDITGHVHFLKEAESSEEAGMTSKKQNWLDRYDVNVLVDNAETKGAPVILETHPTYQNLIGRIEHEVFMGASRTDFKMIRPGALHRANGGYLLLPVRDLLMNPYAYDGLKRSLRDNHIRIVELGSQIGLISTTTLEPEQVDLHVKVVLIGTPLMYYLLQLYDEDFAKLFKVRAEFNTEMVRDEEAEHDYALFVRSVVEENKLRDFDAAAVARIIEEGSRMVEHQQKLSTRFGKIADLARESSYWAGQQDREIVTAEDVACALRESIYRSNLLEERIHERIEEKVLMIDVEGDAIGQVNALSVILLGDFAFGRPSRITATVSAGRGGVVDIERKAELGGPLHTKGVLILNGFLTGRYGSSQPLSLSASLTFEQSYSGVEGDSASAAELVALLSAISGVPVRQDLAITGSMNQHGAIQPIGGVNEKIEGFFAVCKSRGLTGGQGVVIPIQNVPHLMLRQDVVEAVTEGRFHIWPVESIDEALMHLTGLEPGQREGDGAYPAGSLNALVEEKLVNFTEQMKEIAPPQPTTNGQPA